jgi:hypothetical protein
MSISAREAGVITMWADIVIMILLAYDVYLSKQRAN